jgi:hypothetical protein
VTPQQRLQVMRLEHAATGAAIEALEQQEREKKWANRPLSSLTRAEKVELVGELGFEEFRRRVEREYQR